MATVYWLSCTHIEAKLPFNIPDTDSSSKIENIFLALSKNVSAN